MDKHTFPEDKLLDFVHTELNGDFTKALGILKKHKEEGQLKISINKNLLNFLSKIYPEKPINELKEFDYPKLQDTAVDLYLNWNGDDTYKKFMDCIDADTCSAIKKHISYINTGMSLSKLKDECIKNTGENKNLYLNNFYKEVMTNKSIADKEDIIFLLEHLGEPALKKKSSEIYDTLIKLDTYLVFGLTLDSNYHVGVKHHIYKWLKNLIPENQYEEALKNEFGNANEASREFNRLYEKIRQTLERYGFKPSKYKDINQKVKET